MQVFASGPESNFPATLDLRMMDKFGPNPLIAVSTAQRHGPHRNQPFTNVDETKGVRSMPLVGSSRTLARGLRSSTPKTWGQCLFRNDEGFGQPTRLPVFAGDMGSRRPNPSDQQHASLRPEVFGRPASAHARQPRPGLHGHHSESSGPWIEVRAPFGPPLSQHRTMPASDTTGLSTG